MKVKYEIIQVFPLSFTDSKGNKHVIKPKPAGTIIEANPNSNLVKVMEQHGWIRRID